MNSRYHDEERAGVDLAGRERRDDQARVRSLGQMFGLGDDPTLAAPPVARVLAHPALDAATKQRLRALRQRYDPVLLLAEIRAAQVALGEPVDRPGTTAVREAAPLPVDVDRFVASLKTAWRDGERRPTHKRAYRRRNSDAGSPMSLSRPYRSLDEGPRIRQPLESAALARPTPAAQSQQILLVHHAGTG